MTKPFITGCVIATAILTGRASAAGIIARLPEDGAWASYEISAARTTAGQLGDAHKATLRVGSVGRSVEQDEPCRWIEFRRDEPGRIVIQKVLVPEKHLQSGGDPLGRVIRAWRKVGEGEPRPLRTEDLELHLFLYLPGPLNDVKELGTRMIDTKLGELECAAVSGRKRATHGQRQFEGQFTSYRHDKASFGVIRWQAVVDWLGLSDRQRSLDCTMTLSDQGGDARSELPNHN